MGSQIQPVAEAAMLIRKPVAEVFEAFIDPEITIKFWFTKSSGRLVKGKEVEWTWEMYDVGTTVWVKSIVPDETIIIEWGEADDRSTVEWSFTTLGDFKTFVRVVNSGFKGSSDELIAQIKDSTGGFTMVLAGLKAYLEHGIRLNLVGDRFPKEMREE